MRDSEPVRVNELLAMCDPTLTVAEVVACPMPRPGELSFRRHVEAVRRDLRDGDEPGSGARVRPRSPKPEPVGA